MEVERLKKALEKLEDPRRTDGGHILHKLEDIIIIGLCTLWCKGDGLGHSWNCRMGYQAVTHSDAYLSGLSRKHWQNACMTGWDAIGKRGRW